MMEKETAKEKALILGSIENQPSQCEPELCEPLLRPKVVMIPRENLEPDPDKMKSYRATDGIEALAESIKEHGGIRVPLQVMKISDDLYRIADGTRRYLASDGIQDELPCSILGDDEAAATWKFEANLFHKGLSPIDKYLALNDAKKYFGYEEDAALAEKYGLSKSEVSTIMSLAKLPKEIFDAERLSPIIALRNVRDYTKWQTEEEKAAMVEHYRRYREERIMVLGNDHRKHRSAGGALPYPLDKAGSAFSKAMDKLVKVDVNHSTMPECTAIIDNLLTFRSKLDDIIGKFQDRKAALENVDEARFNALNSEAVEQEV